MKRHIISLSIILGLLLIHLLLRIYNEQELPDMRGYMSMAIIMVLLVWAVHHKETSKRRKEALDEQQESIEAYKSEIKKKDEDLTASEKRIGAMATDMEELRRNHFDIIAKGRRLYDSITAGGRTVAWSNDDCKAFVEYCRARHADVLKRIEDEYTGLTPNNKVVMLLAEIVGGDDELRRITGMTAGSLRTMRHRMRKKQRQTE